MHKAFQFRLYPKQEQATIINKTIGSSRFVFNHFLAKRKEIYASDKKSLGYNDCAKQLTELKKEFVWLKEVDSTSLQQSLKFLDDAYKRFFKKQNDFPRFKSRRNPVQSYKTVGKMKVEGNRLFIPKLGWVRFFSTLLGLWLSKQRSQKPEFASMGVSILRNAS
jgi:putative transposase